MKSALLLASCVVLSACSRDEPRELAPDSVQSPEIDDTARRDIHDAFKLAQAAPKHASDGGGRAWLELPPGETGAVVAGSSGRWTIVYEAGELGVALKASVYLQVSPFFEWSTPQTEEEQAPGFTRVSTDAAGVTLSAITLDQQLLGIEIGGRALARGEHLRIEYGAGPAGARADPYAEKNSRFWIAVDGDGDGVRKLIADSPGVDVLPGEPAKLVVTLPSTARPGASARVCVALLDARANCGMEVDARIEFVDLPSGVALEPFELSRADRGRKSVQVELREPGTYRLRARAHIGERVLEAESNPLLVAETGPRIAWADLHGHSALSDGTGTPQDYFAYAREVAALDVVALTDHDHWGMLFLDERPDLWQAILDARRAADAGAEFVALAGFEWTNWISGHRHVLFFGDKTPLLSSMNESFETPQKLWAALHGLDALSVPHHPAGGPIALDWSAAPDLAIEPVAELSSAHGSSEALDCPRLIYSPRPGHFVRDALDRGYRYGLIASGDSHDGHPGFTHLGPHYPTGGVTALLVDELSPMNVRNALLQRRCYATSGPRIVLRFAVASARMGETIAAADANRPNNLFLQVSATAPLESLDFVRSGGAVESFSAAGELDYSASATIDDLRPGEWIYLRVVQQDGGMAWSSPVFIE